MSLRVKLRGKAEANRSKIPHYIRNKLRNLAFFEEIATVENDLAMTDAIDTCNSYRWIWVIYYFLKVGIGAVQGLCLLLLSVFLLYFFLRFFFLDLSLPVRLFSRSLLEITNSSSNTFADLG